VSALRGLLLTVSLASCYAAPPPVILISIDTLRADHLSAYGYRAIRTPNIDSFAQQGTLFSDIDAQIPLTLPSHTSLFTSTYPFQNQIEENAERVPAGAITLASVLRANGYKTAAFIGCVFLEREMGLDQGFDFFDSPFNFQAFSAISGSMFFAGTRQNPYSVRDRRDGALVVGAATRWLAANRDQPVFLFLHLFDLHKPYKEPGYDAGVEYVDRLLGSFKQTLIKNGWWDRSLVVLLSDHGESLGDHGEYTHGYFIYRSTLWVPLTMHWPSGSPAYPARSAQPGGLIDVAPTILDFLHISAPPSFEGKSLLAKDSRAIYAESLHTHDAFGWAPLRSLRVGPYKYIQAPRPELYNLQTDPHELHNLYSKDSPQAISLREQLEKLLMRLTPKRPATPVEISPQTRALLGSLGYLAGGPRPALETSGPDPKDRLQEFQLYDKALDFISAGRLDEAIATLRQLLARDPHNTLARRDLGVSYVAKGNYREARPCFEQVLAIAPDDYVAHFELALADQHLGLLREALEHLQTACKIAPDSTQCRAELESLKAKMP
jgi:choline-sulfatase